MLPSAVAFPPMRLNDFSDHRIRRSIRGSLTAEHTDILLTEPVASQLSRFLLGDGRFAFDPKTSHVNSRMPNGDRFISVCYVLVSADKSSAAQLLYGT